MAAGSRLVDGNRTGARRRPPLPASPPRTAGGRGERPIALRKVRRTSLPHAVRGGGSGEGGGSPSRAAASDPPQNHPQQKPPPAALGEVGERCSPGGPARSRPRRAIRSARRPAEAEGIARRVGVRRRRVELRRILRRGLGNRLRDRRALWLRHGRTLGLRTRRLRGGPLLRGRTLLLHGRPLGLRLRHRLHGRTRAGLHRHTGRGRAGGGRLHAGLAGRYDDARAAQGVQPDAVAEADGIDRRVDGRAAQQPAEGRAGAGGAPSPRGPPAATPRGWRWTSARSRRCRGAGARRRTGRCRR